MREEPAGILLAGGRGFQPQVSVRSPHLYRNFGQDARRTGRLEACPTSGAKHRFLAQAFSHRFAHALDPYSPERDRAEQVFQQEIVELYDQLERPKPELHAFQKAVILRCRLHLRASEKPPSV